jgi:ribosomal protein S18 acetylase RimI-like enzyme
VSALTYRINKGDVALGYLSIASVLALREQVGMGTRTLEEVRRQIEGARHIVTAHHTESGELIGFARAISDEATNGYISSVMVSPPFQRQGIGRKLIMQIVEGRDHVRWVLHTRKEAAAFYEALGFTPAPDMMWRERR